jgi:TRAP-type C4-dicarboxylate transport system permease small subunit
VLRNHFRSQAKEVPASSAGTYPAQVRAEPDGSEEAYTAPLVAKTGRKSILWKLVDLLLLCGVTGMLTAVALQVLTRMQLHSLPWTEELTRYLFIWTTFVGLAAGFRSAEHARIDLVVSMLPRAFQRFTLHLRVAAGLLFFSVVAYYGYKLTLQQYHSGEMSPALGIGMFIVTLPVVLSALLAMLALVESAYFDPVTRQRLLEGERVE